MRGTPQVDESGAIASLRQHTLARRLSLIIINAHSFFLVQFKKFLINWHSIFLICVEISFPLSINQKFNLKLKKSTILNARYFSATRVYNLFYCLYFNRTCDNSYQFLLNENKKNTIDFSFYWKFNINESTKSAANCQDKGKTNILYPRQNSSKSSM